MSTIRKNNNQLCMRCVMDQSVPDISFDENGFCNYCIDFKQQYEIYEDKNNKLIIISKAFPNNARKSRELLKIHGIDEYFNSIIFCERREDKAKISEAMRVNVMIDDTEEVLSHFPSSIRTILYKKGEEFEI